MGGQACVLYGAAEFSRDTDLAVLASPANLARLRAVLRDLQAHVVAVPPFEVQYLRRGHAVHFRCEDPDAAALRIDVMTVMRGVAPFSDLWRRRMTVELQGGLRCHLLALPDLVCAKKTQRDKDWPMIRRLVEAHYFENRDRPLRSHVSFWMRELRTPSLLVEAVTRWPDARAPRGRRRILAFARQGNERDLGDALAEEERREREADAAYWRPLRAELEALRHSGPSGSLSSG
jgi:hypothetical protein